MVYWITRFYCKCIEILLRGCTKLRYFGEPDPSLVLTDNFTQLQWEHIVRAQNLPPLVPSMGTALDLESTSEPACENSRFPTVGLKTLIVIPMRDKWNLTVQLLQTLEAQHLFSTLAKEFRVKVVLVDNGSEEEKTANGLRYYAHHPNYAKGLFQVLRINTPFNFSYLNNKAVELNKEFAPEILLFLNNDVSFTEQGQLQKILLKSAEPGVGAVGCTLLYPNGNVQHLFVAPGVKIVGAHPMRGVPWQRLQTWRRQNWPVPAVTGAVLALRSASFLSAGGFDETFATAYQDVDLCLKLQKKGLVNWTLSNVALVHHETATRRHAHNKEEVVRMYQKWGAELTENPWYSSKFSRWSESPVFALGEGRYPWKQVL